MTADAPYSQVLDVFAVVPSSPGDPTSEVSSAGQSSEHLHLASRKPLTLKAKDHEQATEGESQEDSDGAEEEADTTPGSPSAPAIIIEEQQTDRSSKYSQYGTIKRLRKDSSPNT